MLGTLLDFAVFTLLRARLGLPILIANTISYSTGTVNNYTWHRLWAFAGRPRKAMVVQFSQFAAVSLSTLLLNNLVVLLLAQRMGNAFADPALGDILAKVCATSLGVCWNFLANNLWTFRDTTGRTYSWRSK